MRMFDVCMSLAQINKTHADALPIKSCDIKTDSSSSGFTKIHGSDEKKVLAYINYMSASSPNYATGFTGIHSSGEKKVTTCTDRMKIASQLHSFTPHREVCQTGTKQIFRMILNPSTERRSLIRTTQTDQVILPNISNFDRICGPGTSTAILSNRRYIDFMTIVPNHITSDEQAFLFISDQNYKYLMEEICNAIN